MPREFRRPSIGDPVAFGWRNVGEVNRMIDLIKELEADIETLESRFTVERATVLKNAAVRLLDQLHGMLQ